MKPVPESYYEILGLPKTAAEKEIRAAYRKLARKYHPDVNPGNAGAETRFKKINEAYEVLSDARTRKDYDEFGENWKHADELRKAGVGPGAWAGSQFRGSTGGSARTSTQGFDGLFDFFNFGGRGVNFEDIGSPVQQAQTLEVRISLEEAYRGTTRLISLDHGGGRQSRLEVKVPAGISDGGKVRIRPEGGVDLQLSVSIEPDSRFRREGSDLYTEVQVSLYTALLGGEVTVPTMTGRVALKIPRGTQNGTNFRIAGRGMPLLGSPNVHGDLYATVRVVLPDQVTEEEAKLFERLREMDERKRSRANA